MNKHIFKLFTFSIVCIFFISSCSIFGLYKKTLTIENGGNGTVSVSPESPDGKYEKGTLIRITVTPDKDYYFAGTSGDMIKDNEYFSFYIDEDTTISFDFKKIICKIDTDGFSSYYGTLKITPEADEFTINTEVTLEVIPEDGYYFSYWTGDIPEEKKYENPVTIFLTKDICIDAEIDDFLTLETDVYAYEDNYGSGTITINPDKTEHKYNEVVTITATPDDNSVFSEWYGWRIPDENKKDNPLKITLNRSMSIEAKFLKKYTLTINSNGNGTVSPGLGNHKYTDGDKVPIEATPNSGYLFKKWSGDVTSSYQEEQSIEITMDTDKTITAEFVKAYKLNVETTGPGSVRIYPSEEDYLYKEDTTVSIFARAGDDSTLKNWTGDFPAGYEYEEEIDVVMNENKTLTAEFTPGFVLLINQTGDGQGSITPSSGRYIYDKDEVVAITASVDEGSIFKGWSGDIPEGESKNLTFQLTMDSSKEISAEFAKGYKLIISNIGTGTGTVDFDDEFYAAGDNVTVRAEADAGSTFAGWSGDHTSYNERKTFTFGSSDISLNAEFTHNVWTVMVYLDADNNLEYYGINDINEMEAVNLYGSGINVIALVDRTPGEYYGAGDWKDTRLYQIKYDSGGESNSTIVSKETFSVELGVTPWDSTELNMGDPETAKKFIEYCKDSHPADNYAFIFWNHGTGWRSANIPQSRSIRLEETITPGFETDSTLQKEGGNIQGDFKAVASDDTSGDILFTQEVGSIFADEGVDIVGFDLCLGGMIEVAYEIKDYANYMIASEEKEPGDGWEYDTLLNKFKASSLSQLDFVNSAVDAYESRYSSQTGTTLSGIDLTKIDNVITKLNSFSDALYSSITNSTIQSEIREILYVYVEDYYTKPGDLNIDLQDAAEKIKSDTNYADTEATELISAIETAVVAEWHNTGTTSKVENLNSNGLAIHLISLNSLGTATGHNTAYIKNFTPAVDYPLSFVQNSTWVPSDDKSGLLYRLFYEDF